MSTRTRQEKFIRDFDYRGSFDAALAHVISKAGGLSFFTDEQLEEITAEMVRKERWHSSFRVVQRRQALARQRANA